MGHVESELEYTEDSLNHSLYFEAYGGAPAMGQPSLEHPTDVLIVVLTLPINTTFPCCPGCEVLNELVVDVVPIDEPHPIVLPVNNQGCAVRRQVVHTSQCGHCGGRSD